MSFWPPLGKDADSPRVRSSDDEDGSDDDFPPLERNANHCDEDKNEDGDEDEDEEDEEEEHEEENNDGFVDLQTSVKVDGSIQKGNVSEHKHELENLLTQSRLSE